MFPAISSKVRSRRFSWRELRNSLLATLALGLALGASLASSVAASEGNLSAAVGLAGIALLLALVITLTVVPRLLQRVHREWLWISLSVTREGWSYLLTLLVIAFAAFNTGNNLIFIILSAALALLVVSEALSSLNLRWLDLKIDLPESVPACQAFTSALRLDNSKTWLPTFSLSLEASVHVVLESDNLTRSRADAGKHLQLAYFQFLGAERHLRQTLSLQLPHRGRHRVDSLRISTRFPFGFVNKRRKIADPVEIIALPKVEASNEFLQMLPLLNGKFESLYRGSGSDLHSIREYAPHDSARFLDWKASAKTGQMLVREFTKEEDRKCCLIFDNGFPNYHELDEPAFEKAVNLCANAARYFSEVDCEIRIVTPQAATQYSRSRGGLLEILTVLALIQPGEPGKLNLTDLAEERSFKILFTPNPRSDFPASLFGSTHVVFLRE